MPTIGSSFSAFAQGLQGENWLGDTGFWKRAKCRNVLHVQCWAETESNGPLVD